MIGLDNPLHIALLLLVLLLVFGAKRLPEMGRSLGHGLRGFKESLSGETREPAAELDPVGIQPSPTSAAPAATAATQGLNKSGAEPPAATGDAPSARAA